MKLIIAGCAKNCGRYLDGVLKNIDVIRSCFKDVKIIFAYDNSHDTTLERLRDYKLKNLADADILMCCNTHKHRTVNIANARNCIMDYVQKKYSDYDLLCFLDLDDIINKPIDPMTIYNFMGLYDQWDAISFNRDAYYDIWALRFNPYLCSCWGFGSHSPGVVSTMQGEIVSKLNALKMNELLDVKSAFNGIAFFKLNKFINCRFTGLFKEDQDFYNPLFDTYLPSVDDCEWVSFYDDARKIDPNIKIMISPMKLY